MMNLYAYKTRVNDRELMLLSLIDLQHEANVKGDKAIIGYLKDEYGPVEHDNIFYNPQFIDRFHKTMKFFAQFSDAMISMAEQQQHGFIYITDQRGKDEKEQDAADIIGSFEVKNGEILHDSYQPNPAYRLVSKKGLFRLPQELEALLLTAISG